jgi:hypothetical protein
LSGLNGTPHVAGLDRGGPPSLTKLPLASEP